MSKLVKDKVMPLKKAVGAYVHDGCHMAIGGFTINRNPMAAVYTIIRAGIKDLHLYVHSNGQGVDELIGAGSVSKVEIAYGGSGKFAATCIRFRKAIEKGTLQVEDYSNYQMTLRFLAGAMGVPFLPTRSSLGSDIVDKWGFSENLRRSDPKLPNRKLTVLDNPFEDWGNTEKVVLVPAITPDVTLLHVQQADRAGNCRMDGLSFADVEQAKASRHLVVTCEELMEGDALHENAHHNQIPFIHVDAVVHVPFGAYPTACYQHYDYDPVYLKAYAVAARDDEKYKDYLDTYVYGVADHQALIERIGTERMESIKADPRTGYAANLDRR
ncbi:CoA transferase subunit A [Desulfosarcina ovata]|uniref:Glutaconate CoA-transferase subunit A n=1 Tax=Desulfosarcina ovata subsp. ovata TaxID=2752305 RepID=A0A5K8A8Y0_9BACT|nr:CoA-transferase [Desulfosarcina ovata]BBO88931.1 glutaconate CoA-transferase subunit A [Desulfosarcina ovata subsp. ovata]